MALLGQAALAMWWNIAAPVRADFEDWHAHEHFPERLGLPGFRRATRWQDADGGEGMFVVYELADHGVLSSPDYVARLNAPTPWSTRLMPHHRAMVRSQCRVLVSRGAGTARHALTLRLSPQPGQETPLQAHLEALIDAFPSQPGGVGAHLLRHDTPDMAPTTEQQIRQGLDGVADWVLVCCAYQREALEALRAQALAPQVLAAHGAAPGSVAGLYGLACSATPGDMR